MATGMDIDIQTGSGMEMKFEINGNGNNVVGMGALTAFPLTSRAYQFLPAKLRALQAPVF